MTLFDLLLVVAIGVYVASPVTAWYVAKSKGNRALPAIAACLLLGPFGLGFSLDDPPRRSPHPVVAGVPRYPRRDGWIWTVRTVRSFWGLNPWYPGVCAMVTLFGVGGCGVLVHEGVGLDPALWAMCCAVAVTVLIPWVILARDHRQSRAARSRLRRLDRLLAPPEASKRFSRRMLERRLLQDRLAGRGIRAVMLAAGEEIPPCVVLSRGDWPGGPVTRGWAVSFEPIDLDADLSRAREIRRGTASPTGSNAYAKRPVSILIARIMVSVSALAAAFAFAAGFVSAGGPLASLGRLSCFVAAVIGWALLRRLFESGAWTRWSVAPRTIIVDRPWRTGDVTVFRRGESRLWVDLVEGCAWVVKGARVARRRLRRGQVRVLLEAWLSSVDPPPVSEEELSA